MGVSSASTLGTGIGPRAEGGRVTNDQRSVLQDRPPRGEAKTDAPRGPLAAPIGALTAAPGLLGPCPSLALQPVTFTMELLRSLPSPRLPLASAKSRPSLRFAAFG